MKILKKPTYLGTDLQVIEMQANHATAGTYAQRSQAVRVALGKLMVGQRVALVRVAGKECVIRLDEVNSLPAGMSINGQGMITACDSHGVIAIE